MTDGEMVPVTFDELFGWLRVSDPATCPECAAAMKWAFYPQFCKTCKLTRPIDGAVVQMVHRRKIRKARGLG